PLSDRVKESLFSILRYEVVDANFLDLCAGSGNVGIEALSREAGAVTFIDRNPLCIRMITRNLQKCGIATDDPRVTVLYMDALKGLAYLSKNKTTFDIIFLGPPYHSEILLRSLKQISELGLSSQNGTIIAEHHRKEYLPDEIHQLTLFRRERYGDTMLSFYELGEI
ncbi:TPA: 16S rRNA (guanine(966)-N(2))-methyltransferase RsmD, partial [Candidatus Poribacteria bacterium]|nr:16S rRNA (guanine(966)-N(2))-methyltransferase RsmD [Candidatus Poribacteria bacterium]